MAMKKITGLFILFSFVFHNSLTAQTDTIIQRIVLIGDGGELTNGHHPVVDAIRKFVKLDNKTTVLFLGDNIYDAGLPDDQSSKYKAAKAVLDSQLSVADNTDARVIMIPGNHDWHNGKRDGYETIIREQVYFDIINKPNVEFWPKDGCPGPVAIDLGKDVTLLIFDSQWWLQKYDKPGIESDCDCKTNEELLTQIEDIANRNSKKLLLVASHHPFKSNSVHGGYFPLKQHIFPFTDIKKSLYIPLPVLGSIYPIARSVFGTPQDLHHPNYANMINKVSDAVKSHPNVVFAAGHDHGLQLIRDSSRNYIVSGGGCKTNRVSKGKKSLFAEQETGFAVLEVSKNKNVTVSFYTVTDSTRNEFSTTLLNFASLPEPTGDSASRIVNIPNIKYKDSFSISASDKYKPVHGLKKYVLGQNYRKTWTTPVNMKVFNLNKERGGFTILSFGGGKQTKSLRLKENKTGKEWVLRSVDKNPTKAIPENFRGTLAQDLVQQFNSASNPYAALTIPVLAKPLNIAVPHPELFFVPDDPSLGYYQPIFKNTVCMLEERDPSFDGSDTKSTAKVLNKLFEEADHRIDQESVLKARLLDIVIGDFDRHFDQWKWGTTDTGKGKIYYPIPRDRDQAYFFSDGALLKSASKKLLPFLAGFKKDIQKVEWLGYSAKDFDRLFLTTLDANQWRKAITDVQQKLSDDVIKDAVKKLPKEVYPIDGKTINDKLISRRNELQRAGMKYYRFISRQVNVVGSNQKEYFKVSNYGNGLEVKVYSRDNGNDTSFVMYDRVFERSSTREIRLYGLNDDDIFDIEKNTDSKIKLRIIGGKGNDTFNIKGNVKTLIYDMNVEGNYIQNNSHTKNRFSKDPPVNSYSILGFKYNDLRIPQFQFTANSDDGLLASVGFWKRTHGFRNEPYATDQKLSMFYSMTRGSVGFRYDGEFNHLTRNIDLLVKGESGYPEVTNFFGLGNSTKINSPTSSKYGYYRINYNYLELQTLIRRRFFENLQLMAGPYFYQYSNKYADNAGKILGNPSLIHLDSADVYSNKTYLGLKLAMKFDNRNSLVFPTRGILWNNEFVSAAGITKSSSPITKFTTDMTIYASLSDPARLVAVLGFGAGKIYNKSFEYFQALNIGNNEMLHGFRKNRYTGRSTAYASTELRFKLFDIKSYLAPGPFGLTGFYDVGRVWLPGERSKVWHSAYGGGIYFIPFNLFMVSASVGFSSDEKLFNFSVGTKINLDF